MCKQVEMTKDCTLIYCSKARILWQLTFASGNTPFGELVDLELDISFCWWRKGKRLGEFLDYLEIKR